MGNTIRRSTWAIFAATLFGVSVVGLVLAVVGAVNSPSRREDLWWEVAKAGVQIAVITGLGALLTAALRIVDERRTRNDQRRGAYNEFVVAYNQVKAVRRNLRALGMLDPPVSLNSEQAHGLRAQMMALNEVQLLLEAFKLKIAEADLFNEASEIVVSVSTAEKYLHDVHERWEEQGGKIWDGATVDSIARLQLVKLIGHKSEASSEFDERLSIPLDRITEIMHRELFGRTLPTVDLGRRGPG